VPDVITAAEARAVEAFVRLVPDSWRRNGLRERALAIAGVFDGFFSALGKVGAKVDEVSKGRGECG